MEKPSLGKKIRKVVGIAGLSALSMLPGEKSQKPPENNIDFSKKEKIELKKEWSRNELESNKEILEKLASVLAIESLSKRIREMQNFIPSFDEQIKQDIKKLEERKFKGESKDDYSNMSNQDILSRINSYKEYKEIIQEDYLTEYKKLQKENKMLYTKEVQKNVNNIKKLIVYYDIGREWLLNNIKDPEYQKRFIQERREDYDLSGEILRNYIERGYKERLENASDKEFVLSKDISTSSVYHGGGSNLEAFYDKTDKKTYYPLQTDSLKAIEFAIHEYAHKVTEYNDLMTIKSMQLFSEALDSLSLVANLIDQSDKGVFNALMYFSNPAEMYARKKVFEWDLERLGVKKYGERFTTEHYTKVIKLLREEKMSQGSLEFITIIKPKMLLRVMNEIADSSSAQKQDQNLA